MPSRAYSGMLRIWLGSAASELRGSGPPVLYRGEGGARSGGRWMSLISKTGGGL